MGQAKQRGSREDRIAQKLGLVKCTIEELKRKLDMPDEAEFIGYGVHLEGSDEFLSDYIEEVGAIRRMWTIAPELAKRFENLSDAYRISLKCKESVVVGIFESDKQMWAVPIQ